MCVGQGVEALLESAFVEKPAPSCSLNVHSISLEGTDAAGTQDCASAIGKLVQYSHVLEIIEESLPRPLANIGAHGSALCLEFLLSCCPWQRRLEY